MLPNSKGSMFYYAICVHLLPICFIYYLSEIGDIVYIKWTPAQKGLSLSLSLSGGWEKGRVLVYRFFDTSQFHWIECINLYMLSEYNSVSLLVDLSPFTGGALVKAALSDEYFVKRKQYPNVDLSPFTGGCCFGESCTFG